MTKRARRERRRLQAHRRQVRRRRAAALATLAALVLLLVALIGSETPAAATSASVTTGAEEGAQATEPESCPEGEVEVEPEPGAEPEGVGEAKIECEPEEAEGEEGTEKEAAEPTAEEGGSSEGASAPASSPTPTPTPAPAAQAEPTSEASEGSAPTHAVRAGSTLDASRGRHHGGGSGRPPGGGTPAPSQSSQGQPAPGDAVSHSGGTPAGAGDGSGQPDNWGWSGSWAIPWQIVACESGGDYGALNASSGAGGAYQILPSTWEAYGGIGEPQTAPPAEQDRIAAEIWADSGPSAWVCAQDGNWLGARLGSLGQLPDPLPPARRLDRRFVTLLTRTARAEHVDWALLLALVRLRGGRGPFPASAAELRLLAGRAAGLGAGPLRIRTRRLFSRPLQAQRLLALTYFDRAVGRRGLVLGLDAIKGGLEKRVLRSPRLLIYPGGRADVAAGRIDVRVLTLLLYLSQRYRSVTVTSLLSGHSFLTTSGNPSLHAFGRAVDIAALDGTPIVGHQQPGGITERALRLILLLPREMQPSELISLFELGGPSFALPDHYDHIHVGF